jgi:hypothetical protein
VRGHVYLLTEQIFNYGVAEELGARNCAVFFIFCAGLVDEVHEVPIGVESEEAGVFAVTAGHVILLTPAKIISRSC